MSTTASASSWMSTQKQQSGWKETIGYFFNFTVFLTVLGLRRYKTAFFSCGEWGLLSSCGGQASHRTGFSCCRAQALGIQASVVVARGRSGPGACGIFLDQGSNQYPLHWQVVFYPLNHQGSPIGYFFYAAFH